MHVQISPKFTTPVRKINRLSRKRSALALACLDVIGGCLVAWASFEILSNFRLVASEQLWHAVLAYAVGWVLIAGSQKIYRRAALFDAGRAARMAVVTWGLCFALVLLVTFGTRAIDGMSRIWLVSWACGTLGWLLLLRAGWSWRLNRLLARDYCDKRVAIAGHSFDAVREAARRMEHETGNQQRVVCTSLLPSDEAFGTDGAQRRQAIDALEVKIRDGGVDCIYVIDDVSSSQAISELVSRLSRTAVEVAIIPQLGIFADRAIGVGRVGTIPVIQIARRPISEMGAFVKRCEDLILSTAGLIVTAPLLLLIMVAIWLESKGPVFFRQSRIGFQGQEFRIWKFRTMYHEMRDESASQQTQRNDPRVTRVGAVLRSTSLDELPQLFNVLANQMSLVGPRPHARGMRTEDRPLEELVSEYSLRYRFKPGLTGLAQVNGFRGNVDSREKLRQRVRYDLIYIDTWSVLLDIKIIVKTMLLVFQDRNAF